MARCTTAHALFFKSIFTVLIILRCPVEHYLLLYNTNPLYWSRIFSSSLIFICFLLFFQHNAKIADYGISKFATAYGLRASEGTPGYRAPEVIRGTSTYNTEVKKLNKGWINLLYKWRLLGFFLFFFSFLKFLSLNQSICYLFIGMICSGNMKKLMS